MYISCLIIFIVACSITEISNTDLTNIVTPVKVNVFADLLQKSVYDVEETNFLIDGFENGFDIGYQGPLQRQSESGNIPFTVGSKEELWAKIIKEVKTGRIAGPFKKIPFDNYIQSPVGLVPKAEIKQG